MMSTSDVAAWWGAAIATLVLIWDVIKWRKSRFSIRISASPNMSSFDQLERKLEDDKNIFVEVVNSGDKIITLTHLVVIHYSNLWELIFCKPSTQGIIPRPKGAQQIPYELEPGKRWTGLIDQKDLERKVRVRGF
jgi:hypothetical protein